MWIFIVIIAVGVVGNIWIMSKLTPEQKVQARAINAKIDSTLLVGLGVASKGLKIASKNSTPKRYRSYH